MQQLRWHSLHPAFTVSMNALPSSPTPPLSPPFSDEHDACLENSVDGDLDIQWIGLVDQSILLCACGADEMLPMNPHLPADLFTCCLTNPIKTALRW